jgi:hypothetical protein
MRNNYRPSIFLTDGPSHILLGGISIVGQEVKLESCMLETRDSQLRNWGRARINASKKR